LFLLDNIESISFLGDTPVGVACGHFASEQQKEDWDNAAIVAKALYKAGHKYMSEQN
jgi:hypothetical protein